MSKSVRRTARLLVTDHPYWERLRWDDEDWFGHTVTDVDETVAVLAAHSRGHELAMIGVLTDLLDEDVYSNAGHVAVHESTGSCARAFAGEINQDRSAGDALRAALEVAENLQSVIVGLIEVSLSHNDAWGSVAHS